MARVVTVTDYGATGDGVTDDTASITSAIAALHAGGSMLVFPPGVYLTSGGFTLANPVKVVGAGRGNKTASTGVSVIKCNHATNSLFTITALAGSFHGLDMVNVAATTPSNGAAVTVNGSGSARQQIDFSACSVRGFYNNLDIQIGNFWSMQACLIGYAVNYGVKINNTVNPDAGDWAISNSVLDCGDIPWDGVVMPAGIRIEGSGGGKIVNTKINGTGERMNNGIDVALANESTVILLVSNCSIENVKNDGISIVHTGTGYFKGIAIRGNQFGFWSGAHGNAPITISAEVAGAIAGVAITDNLIIRAPNAPVINLTNVDKAYIGGNVNLETTDMLAQTDCTNVVLGAVV